MFSRIFTLLLLLIAFRAAAQREAAMRDLIITQAGEQIRCRIVDESSMRFSYMYVNEKGKQVKTEIFKTLISSFKYNYFPEDLTAGKKEPAVASSSAGSTARKAASRPEQDTRPPAREASVPATERKDPPSLQEVATRKEESTPAVSAGKETAVSRSAAGMPAGKEGNTTGAKRETAGNSPADKRETAAGSPDTRPVTEEKTGAKEAATKEIIAKEAVTKEAAADEYVSPLKGKTEFTNYLKYRIGFKGGLGNIIDENTDNTPFGLFNEKLRRGWIYGVDAAVFLNDHVGIGVAYHSYQSANKNNRLDFPNRVTGSDYRTGSLESKVNHKFAGATLLGRIGMDYKTFIVATVSPGYYFYSDKGVENQMEYVFRGGTWGGAATLGIDFLLGSNETGRDVILSFECGYNYGRLKSLDYGGTVGRRDLAEPISLSRLDFAVGLRFTRFPRYLR